MHFARKRETSWGTEESEEGRLPVPNKVTIRQESLEDEEAKLETFNGGNEGHPTANHGETRERESRAGREDNSSKFLLTFKPHFQHLLAAKHLNSCLLICLDPIATPLYYYVPVANKLENATGILEMEKGLHCCSGLGIPIPADYGCISTLQSIRNSYDEENIG